MPDARLRVALADDHYLVREGTRDLLESTGEVEVVAAVATAADLLAAVESARPDAVLSDIRMPPRACDRGHRRRPPDPRGAPGDRRRPSLPVRRPALRADALPRRDLRPRLPAEGPCRRGRRAAARAARGLPRRLGDRPEVVEGLLARRIRRARGAADLTPRELDVLREMAQGRSNAGTARALVLSQSAVEKHVNAILSKLGLTQAQETHRRVAAVLAYLGRAAGED